MDRLSFCDDIEKRLTALNNTLSRLALGEPSGLEASRSRYGLKQKVIALKARIAEALQKTQELRLSSDQSWDAARIDLERRWTEINALQSQMY